MSLSEEVGKKLEALKKASQEFTIYVNSIEGKKMMKETDVSQLESRIEKLKKEELDHRNKANAMIQKADAESSEKISIAKKLMDEVSLVKMQVEEDKKKAQVLKNEAEALMSQAKQRQKEADIMYAQYNEKKLKLQEVLR